jgi:general secretion pathway protein G/type IV pilus assembly protein PilA
MNKSHDTQLVMNLTTLDSAAKVYEMEKGMAPQSVDELVKGKYAPDKDYGGITLESAENGGTGCVFSGTLSSGETVRSSELGKKGGHGGTDA